MRQLNFKFKMDYKPQRTQRAEIFLFISMSTEFCELQLDIVDYIEMFT